MTDQTGPTPSTDATQQLPGDALLGCDGRDVTISEDIMNAVGLARAACGVLACGTSDELVAVVFSELRAARRRPARDAAMEEALDALRRSTAAATATKIDPPTGPPPLVRVVAALGFAGPGEGDIEIRADERDTTSGGGASHEYQVVQSDGEAATPLAYIWFQRGPVDGERNGVTNEQLLLIVKDRLEGFQAGPYSCRQNDFAITHIEYALDELRRRTIDRQDRGVEGKMEA